LRQNTPCIEFYGSCRQVGGNAGEIKEPLSALYPKTRHGLQEEKNEVIAELPSQRQLLVGYDVLLDANFTQEGTKKGIRYD